VGRANEAEADHTKQDPGGVSGKERAEGPKHGV
jgi:hypothetical protein